MINKHADQFVRSVTSRKPRSRTVGVTFTYELDMTHPFLNLIISLTQQILPFLWWEMRSESLGNGHVFACYMSYSSVTPSAKTSIYVLVNKMLEILQKNYSFMLQSSKQLASSLCFMQINYPKKQIRSFFFFLSAPFVQIKTQLVLSRLSLSGSRCVSASWKW